MDKLKVFFAKLKKHHYWVLTGLVVLMSFTGWYLAANALEQETTTNRNKIKSAFDGLRAIVSKTDHPNAEFEKGTNLLRTNLTKDVQKAWTLVFADQKVKVLKWPKELGGDFLEWIDDPDNQKETIPEDFRERYLNYVKEEFPRLLDIVKAKPWWSKDEDEVGGPGGMGVKRKPMGAVAPKGVVRPQPVDANYLVIWDRKNQQAIDEALDFPKGVPDDTATRFCQENLWVYHALLDAIADINQGATGTHNAKIKEIIALSIGQDASQVITESLTGGRIMAADGGANSQAGMPMMPTMPMGEGAAMPQSAPEGMGMGEGPGGMDGKKKLDDKRYVDEKGIPMPTGTTGPAEFKRMPILMRLFMDQREITHLLVRLANSPLPVEIRQLRINTKMSGFSNPRPFMFGAGADGGGALGGRGGPGVMKRDKAMEEAFQNPNDLAIEMHGIIYIFNPPDKALSEAIAAEIAESGEGGLPPTDASTPVSKPVEGAVEPAETTQDESVMPAEGEASGEDTAKPATDEPADADAAEVESTEVAEESTEASADESKPAAPQKKPAAKPPAAKSEDDAPFGEE